jgi:hypothetical protein
MSSKNKLLYSLAELLIHFFYLICFYVISAYFGKSTYLNEILKSIFSPDSTRILVISLLITFSFIGFIFCLSIVSNNKIDKYDFKIAEVIFKFGIDYLYFITLTSAALGSIVLFLMPIEKFDTTLNVLFIACGFFLASFCLRIIHHSFEVFSTEGEINLKNVK